MPRIIVAGLSGRSGKTVVSLALLQAAREQGRDVRAFKKGPDYLDAAWLAWASGRPARNLDTFLMGAAGVRRAFARHATRTGLNVIEGNRGLHDGSDAVGSHSTAELAKLLDVPVLLVVDATRTARTAAAMVLGCRSLDPAVRVGGVILNQVSGKRHEKVLCAAVADECGLPVVGVVRQAAAEGQPGRSNGPFSPDGDGLRAVLREAARGLYLDRIWEIASRAGEIEAPGDAMGPPPARRVRVGVVRDRAFPFYYPENLEALASAGADLVEVSALDAAALPEGIGALYIGGAFHESYAPALAANRRFRESLRTAAAGGLPVYAESGGLILLAEAIQTRSGAFPMAGVLPFEVEACSAPQAHGYTRLSVEQENAFFRVGATLSGHQFHHARIVARDGAPRTACAVARATGFGAPRDAVVAGNVWAAFTHLHALATPEWAAAMVAAARRHTARAAAATGAR